MPPLALSLLLGCSSRALDGPPDARAPTYEPGETDPGPPADTDEYVAPEDLSDPDAVWDCPAPGTICRFAGGGGLILSWDTVEDVQPTRNLGLSSCTHLVPYADSELYADCNVPLVMDPSSTDLLPHAREWHEAQAGVGNVAFTSAERAIGDWVYVEGFDVRSHLVELEVPTGRMTPLSSTLWTQYPQVGEQLSQSYATFVNLQPLPDGWLATASFSELALTDPNGIVQAVAARDSVTSVEADTLPFDDLPTESVEAQFAVTGNALFVSDRGRGVIWKVDPITLTATRLAGTARTWADDSYDILYTSSGDGGLATDAVFRQIHSIAGGPSGEMYVFDHSCVRVVRPDGVIERFAGSCNEDWPTGRTGDGGPALDATFLGWGPIAVQDGFLYVSEIDVIRRIWIP